MRLEVLLWCIWKLWHQYTTHINTRARVIHHFWCIAVYRCIAIHQVDVSRYIKPLTPCAGKRYTKSWCIALYRVLWTALFGCERRCEGILVCKWGWRRCYDVSGSYGTNIQLILTHKLQIRELYITIHLHSRVVRALYRYIKSWCIVGAVSIQRYSAIHQIWCITTPLGLSDVPLDRSSFHQMSSLSISFRMVNHILSPVW